MEEKKVEENKVEEKKQGSVFDIIFSPRQFFERNMEKSRVFIPFLLVIVSTLALQWVSLPISVEEQEVWAKMGTKPTGTIKTVVMVVGMIGGGIGAVISILLISLVIFLCVRYILKGQTGYKQMLSVYLLSLVPSVLQSITYAIVYSVTGHIEVSPRAVILTAINPLQIWSIVLLIIGIAVTAKVSMKKSSILVIILSVISISFSIISSLI